MHKNKKTNINEIACYTDTKIVDIQNDPTPDDDKKYSREGLGRRCGTISLPRGSQHKKNHRNT